MVLEVVDKIGVGCGVLVFGSWMGFDCAWCSN